MLCPGEAGANVTVEGETVREKSGGGAEIIRATAAVWVSIPETPVNVMVADPAAAVEATVSVMF
jgi:hypothetical protein